MKNTFEHAWNIKKDLIIIEPNKRTTNYHFFDRSIGLTTEIWESLQPQVLILAEFKTYVLSASLDFYEAPRAGNHPHELLLCERKIWLALDSQNNVDKMLNYVDNNYRPLGNIKLSTYFEKNPHVVHIKAVK